MTKPKVRNYLVPMQFKVKTLATVFATDAGSALRLANTGHWHDTGLGEIIETVCWKTDGKPELNE